uniref:Uncharacterized protein n=1 Tax=Stomoxys calcitrans TaxID=35570 RepID=A0A1I8Q5D9_STOCA
MEATPKRCLTEPIVNKKKPLILALAVLSASSTASLVAIPGGFLGSPINLVQTQTIPGGIQAAPAGIATYAVPGGAARYAAPAGTLQTINAATGTITTYAAPGSVATYAAQGPTLYTSTAPGTVIQTGQVAATTIQTAPAAATTTYSGPAVTTYATGPVVAQGSFPSGNFIQTASIPVTQYSGQTLVSPSGTILGTITGLGNYGRIASASASIGIHGDYLGAASVPVATYAAPATISAYAAPAALASYSAPGISTYAVPAAVNTYAAPASVSTYAAPAALASYAVPTATVVRPILSPVAITGGFVQTASVPIASYAAPAIVPPAVTYVRGFLRK